MALQLIRSIANEDSESTYWQDELVVVGWLAGGCGQMCLAGYIYMNAAQPHSSEWDVRLATLSLKRNMLSLCVLSPNCLLSEEVLFF